MTGQDTAFFLDILLNTQHEKVKFIAMLHLPSDPNKTPNAEVNLTENLYDL